MHQAPPLVARWLAGALPRPIEEERLATCSDCAMAPGPAFESVDEAFTASAKCCTFFPDLRNFQVGNVLADTDAMGAGARRSLEQRILDGVSVTPLGIPAAPVYAALYDLKSPSSFGRAQALVCPFYIHDGGLCGIHRHREAVCSTWFCKHNRGPAGRLFWTTVEQFLRTAERALVLWCIDQSDLPVDCRRALFTLESRPRNIDPNSLAGKANPAVARFLWGPLLLRQVEFFMSCAQKVNALSWAEVLEIGGAPLATATRIMRETQEHLDDALPDQVAPGAGQRLVQITSAGAARVRSGVSPGDRLDLPMALVQALPRQRGPLPELRAALAARGLTLDDDLLRQLIDFQVLIPA